MGFDEEREDFFGRGGDDGPSKRDLLDVIVGSGAVIVGREGGVEVPYYGVLSQAEELRQEGLIKRHPEQPIADATIWLPTEVGKKLSTERRKRT